MGERKKKSGGNQLRSYIFLSTMKGNCRPWFGKEPFKQGLISGLGYFILWVILAGFVFLLIFLSDPRAIYSHPAAQCVKKIISIRGGCTKRGRHAHARRASYRHGSDRSIRSVYWTPARARETVTKS